ncbi:hypothetical protein H6G41_34010 [Tolypothrix sp. FACHB-123]|uniref:hypothetical protein n=1 Tax=Tolypothrix sp. FACHB-123 TaxID=2692868 RepID=UPI001689ECB7|nr:hypothetical protein [Tolypothrix sp. FACHB-123]MBD2359503.1 hypothetical protein [Tolypothrix sp. FACHB-123]
MQQITCSTQGYLMNKFILLILVITISYFTAVKPDANFLDTALRVMLLIEKVEQWCGKKPEKEKKSNNSSKKHL